MRRLALLLCALLLAAPARAQETLPSSDAQLAAGAVVSMHNAVMRDALHSDYEFTLVSGSDPTFMLYSDADARAFLLVAFDESADRAETAVVQAYDLKTYEERALPSLKAIALPFLKDEEQPEFDAWLAAQSDALRDAYYAGEDYELDYLYGDYVACALSLYHEDGRAMFTAVAHWYDALSADDITALMEG